MLSLVPPFKNIPCSFKLLATSLGPCPETSIQVLENNAQAELNEKGTSDNKEDINDGVDGVRNSLKKRSGRGDVVDKSSNWNHLSLVASLLPVSEESSQERTLEIPEEHLREEIHVRNQRRLQDNWYVGSVEESDGI